MTRFSILKLRKQPRFSTQKRQNQGKNGNFWGKTIYFCVGKSGEVPENSGFKAWLDYSLLPRNQPPCR